jgi:FAD/FMN-containing dehydrogenase
MGKYRGASRVALKPKTTAQVSAVLAHCNQRRLAVVPQARPRAPAARPPRRLTRACTPRAQGGNTGLVGGSVPVFDEVVLSLANMKRVLSVDAAAGVAVAEAGVVLEALDAALAEQGLCVPLDLGAKGSCQIGAPHCAAGATATRADAPRARPRQAAT